MEYLRILNAFEQTYYNRIKEIERVAAAAVGSNHRLRSITSNSSPMSSGSSSSSSSSSGSSNGSPPNHLTNNPYHYQHHQHPHHHHHHAHHHHPAANRSHLNGHHSNATNVANSLLWQPWRDFTSSAAVAAAAAAHHHFYQQQQQHHHQQQQIQHQHQQQLQQHNLQKESRLTAKELPTTKWRRDRRMRAASEYQHSLSSQNSPSVMAAAASPPPSPPIMRPLCESTNRTTLPIIESPIDMSVTSTTMKPRASPPPPYREPLPGSTFATTLARPSVITQAPPKRGDSRDSILISNRENDNQSTESISMCETVIDEHFRRSLGPDYIALFGKKSPVPSTPSPTPTPTPPPQQQPVAHMQPMASVTPTLLHQAVEAHRSTPTPPAAVILPQPQTQPQALTTKPILSPVSPPEQSPPHVAAARVESPHLTANETSSSTKRPSTPPTTTTTIASTVSSMPSVDDHFAKALGDTWKKLQADKEQRN